MAGIKIGTDIEPGKVERARANLAAMLGENAFDQSCLDYVRKPQNGYFSQPLPFDTGRGTELTLKTR